MADQNNNDKYIQALKAITEEQSKIVGDEIAMSLAQDVKGLDMNNGDIKISGDPKSVLEMLVNKYYVLFGDVSISVSKDVVHDVVPELNGADLPANLQ